MSLPTLFNLPTDETSLAYFSFANADEHNRIVTAIFASTGQTLPTYVLDPVPTFDIQNWLRRHQDIHNQQNLILSIAGNDLSDVDFKNKEQLEAWIQLHAQEHYLASQRLGIV